MARLTVQLGRGYYTHTVSQQEGTPSASPQVTGLFVALVGLFVTFLITANIIAVKLISIDPALPGFLGNPRILPAAIVVFPITYILGDVLTEVYGFRYARRVIWLAFLCNAAAVLAFWVGEQLPSAGFWEGQEAYKTILGNTRRLLVASFAAFLVGEFSNSIVLSRLKLVTNGRWLWMRTIGSTIVGQGVDSAIFITIAFVNTLPDSEVLKLILTQWTVKVLYEAVATPITYAAVTFLKRHEGFDAYDQGVSLNPLAAFK